MSRKTNIVNKSETYKIRINGQILDTEYCCWVEARIDISALQKRGIIKATDVVEIIEIEITTRIDRITDITTDWINIGK